MGRWVDVGWWVAVSGVIVAGLAGPGVDLRRRGLLSPRTLVASWWAHLRALPEALATTVRESVRHPFTSTGPPVGFALFVSVAAVGALGGVAVLVVGGDPTGTVRWTAWCAAVVVGGGMFLVRSTLPASRTDLSEQQDGPSPSHLRKET